MILQIDQALLKAVVDACEAAYPSESCGLIIGRGRGQLVRATRIVPAPNLMADSSDRFELDPSVRIAVEKELREQDVVGRDRILGHWHSHPDGSPDPSAVDRASAYEPDLIWLIVAVASGQAIQAQAHRLDPKRGAFRPVPLRIPKK